MKKLMENWNQYIEEENEIFDSSGALVESNEEHQLDEAIIVSAIALATLGKVFVILFKALSAKKELEDLNKSVQASRLPDGVKDTTTKTLELLDTVEKNAPAIQKAADIMGVGGNVNPLNWKQNALILVIKKAVEKLGTDQSTPPEKEKPKSEPKAAKPAPKKPQKSVRLRGLPSDIDIEDL